MADFLILTAEQADAVRGPTIAPGMLNPIERAGGVFILPAAVLKDPCHAPARDALLELPSLDSADPLFPASLDSESE